MPHNAAEKRRYIYRVNSNGEEVYPTVCATQYKGVQQQMDKGGYYIIEKGRYIKDNEELK